jgi:hypothetical protein
MLSVETAVCSENHTQRRIFLTLNWAMQNVTTSLERVKRILYIRGLGQLGHCPRSLV